jgi:CheY-like chemotaxis protein
VARVTAIVPDLLFGSKVQAMLEQAGHEVRMTGSGEGATDAAAGADVLVVDLTTDAFDGVALVQSLRAGGTLQAPVLAFYSHVDVEVRRRAEEAGLDLVVPRSRMVREGADLVARLAR